MISIVILLKNFKQDKAISPFHRVFQIHLQYQILENVVHQWGPKLGPN